MTLRRPNDPPVDDASEAPDAADAQWRVTIEEWERFPGDVLAAREIGALHTPIPKWEQRLVFADEILM